MVFSSSDDGRVFERVLVNDVNRGDDEFYKISEINNFYGEAYIGTREEKMNIIIKKMYELIGKVDITKYLNYLKLQNNLKEQLELFNEGKIIKLLYDIIHNKNREIEKLY